MSIPKLTGIETEYGIFVLNAPTFDPFASSRLVLSQCEEAGPLLHRQRKPLVQMVDEDEDNGPVASVTAADGYGSYSEGGYGAYSSYSSYSSYGSGYMAAYGWDYSSLMLPNGARFYIDHAHPEYCTPETLTPRMVVAADKAGEILVERCRLRANASGLLPEGQEIAIYKNNSDNKGSSYGCHENYLLSATLYEDLIRRKFHRTLRVLIPFLITRSIYTGAGKVGTEGDTPLAGFQLTQRADFFETLIGLQTTHNRPLINTRDESHAFSDVYRRLHVIVGDANLAEISTFLKVGATQLVLMMLEDNAIQVNFTLDDPLEAFQAVSRDLSLSKPLQIESNGQITALEMQRQFLAAARDYVEQRPDLPARESYREVIAIWADTLDKLGRDWKLLSKRLDWCIKRNILERYLFSQGSDWNAVALWELPIELTLHVNRQSETTEMTPDETRAALRSGMSRARAALLDDYLARKGLSYADYWKQREIYFTLRRLDLEYHDIRRDGLFYRLQGAGAVERLLTDADIARLVEAPPEDSRAYLRGKLLARYAALVTHADWGEISLREPGGMRDYRLTMPDPTVLTREQVEPLLDSAPDLPSLVRSLRSLEYGT